MRFHTAFAPTGLTLAALCTGGLLLSEGCRSDELQGPGHTPEGLRPPAMATAPTSGLVGEWKLDETGGTIANDTKNNYDATVSGGAAFVSGKLGNALNLNNGTAGTGLKYAEMPSNATLDAVQEGNYSISAWFYPYSIPPNTTPENKTWAIVNKAGQHMGLVYDNDGTFAARHWVATPTGDVLEIARSPVKPVNAWYHLVSAVNRTAGTLKLYVNGTLVGTPTFTPGTAPHEYGTTPFRIGRARNEWSADGKVDQVRIYNRELSAAEVSDLYGETIGSGVPFGPGDLFNASGGFRQVPPAPFTWTMDVVTPGDIIDLITAARNNHVKLTPVMTGGGHANYLTNGVFDFQKWKDKQDLFDTPEIKSAVAAGVADGTILFAVLMDEPNHPDWNNSVHHADLDAMAQYTNGIFPTLRTGVDVRYDWEQTQVYQNVDVITSQYSARKGDVNAYRTAAVSAAAQQNAAMFFSINVLNGGTPPTNGSCPTPATGGPGSTENGVLVGCKMTAAQVQSFGDALLAAPEACGLKMWTWDLTTLTPSGDFMTRADNKAAFSHLATTAAAHAPRACVKPR
jgi:hypothetical protein